MNTDVETQLRAHLQRKLKILNGKGQITVRRLVYSLYPRDGNGFKYAEKPSTKGRHWLYATAARVCEEAGGKLYGLGWTRHSHKGNVASRVYQF